MSCWLPYLNQGSDLVETEQLIAALWVWGKTDRFAISHRRGGPAWNPLLAHMLDVAACTGQLWDVYLAQPIRRRLSDAFGPDDDTARRTVMFLAALHDLGKAATCFLDTFATGPWSGHRLQEAAKEWEQGARAAGLPLPATVKAQRWVPHQNITAAHLPRLLGCTCRICGGSGVTDAGLHAVAALLSGHHGHIADRRAIDQAYSSALPETWDPIRRELINTLAKLVGLEPSTLPGTIDLSRPSVLPTFAGLVTQADWLASDENQFHYRSLEEPVSMWWQQSQQDAVQATDEHHLHAWCPTEQTWQELFPGTEPRTFQKMTMNALPGRGPALVIVESPTGAGKTRVALWGAAHFARTCGYHGFYQAMPTRAATDQHAIGSEAFILSTTTPGTIANLAIAHGVAPASPVVHRLVDAHRPDLISDTQRDLAPFLAEATCATGGDQQPALVVLDPWYFKRCRALLSPFGIGTIDQITLAAQRSRHWFLRLFGLVNKTVIIDEAHAYDLYQQRILEATIAWLADAGSTLIILSATLPRTVRDSLVQAWCRGHQTRPVSDGPEGAITIVDHQGAVKHLAPPPDEPEPAVVDFLNDPGQQELAARLLSESAAGGITLVVRNRVRSADALYAELLKHADKFGWHEEEIVLVHGHQLPRERFPIMDGVVGKLGPDQQDRTRRNLLRPERLIVVGTQVLEQSLDIDADRLYTDLAPIDLLIQRIGRLWRHCVNDSDNDGNMGKQRHSYGQPQMTIIVTLSPSELPAVEHFDATGQPTDAAVYPPYLLVASWHVLNARMSAEKTTAITGSGDHRTLIEAVYTQSAPTVPGPIGDLLTQEWKQWQADLEIWNIEAHNRLVEPFNEGAPAKANDLSSGDSHGDGGDGEQQGMPGLAAKSRLTDASVPVVVLYEQSRGFSFDPDDLLKADLRDYSSQHTIEERVAHRDQQRAILLNTIEIPLRWFAVPNGSTNSGASWIDQFPALAGRTVLLLTPDGRSLSPGLPGVAYTPIRGLARNTRR